MAAFRYAQFCPLARAAEVLGERWTLLILRELMLGPKRFSDLRRPLVGLSASVLSERLARLEERGLVTRVSRPPPTPAELYELSEAGRALLPAMIELGRWGLRFLGPPEPGDRLEPEWVRLGLVTFARRGASPRRSFAIALRDGAREVAFRVCGGRRGPRVEEGDAPVDARIFARSPLAILGLASGGLDPDAALRSGEIEVEGDPAALADFPALFELAPS